MDCIVSFFDHGRFTQVETDKECAGLMLLSCIQNKYPTYFRDDEGKRKSYFIDDITPREILEGYISSGWMPFGFMSNARVYDYLRRNARPLTSFEMSYDNNNNVKKIVINDKTIYIEFFTRDDGKEGYLIEDVKYIPFVGLTYDLIEGNPIIKE